MITEFRGEYRFLSNFWPVKVTHQGLAFPSVEHAYQAAKCHTDEDRLRFTRGSAGDAKRLGRRVRIRTDWNEIKLGVMEELVRKKFAPGTGLAAMLLDTGEQPLIEGNTWGDKFWGCTKVGGNWVGQNNLGKILMMVREELKGNAGGKRP